MKKEHFDKITQYWLSHSAYDLKTAEVMLKGGRYLYVAFMCQQSIEKLLKGLITLVSSETPPYSHNLTRLAEIAKIIDKLSLDQKDYLAFLTPFCIEARYADYMEKMSKLANKKLASEILPKTKEIYKCLKKIA